MTDPRRRIPGTDALLAEPQLAQAALRLGQQRVKQAIQQAQQRARQQEIAPEEVLDRAAAMLPPTATGMRRVRNATGVVVHTNLGRAPLSQAAQDAVREAAGYTDVEFDLDSGARAKRGSGALAALAAAVPDAADVHVVNNNAAALVLCALAMATDGEIIISRGEMVEIGDGFRIPDLLAGTGARLREVGTTNRTSAADYAAAIGERTGFILKVHPSNFVVRGFTAAPDIAELTELGVPVVADIGSGLLSPHPQLPEEPDARSALRAGADVVTASGDKLLGGPQAGLLLGRADLVHRLRRHPVARALRVDKLTLAALEASLLGPPTPVAAALLADADRLWQRADAMAARLAESGVDAQAVTSSAAVGGGGAPEVELPSAAVSLPAAMLQPLRACDPPVVGRVLEERTLLDLRTLEPEEDASVLEAVLEVNRRCM